MLVYQRLVVQNDRPGIPYDGDANLVSVRLFQHPETIHCLVTYPEDSGDQGIDILTTYWRARWGLIYHTNTFCKKYNDSFHFFSRFHLWR